MTISGAARVAGVIGDPIAHSRSPILHGHWLNRYGIDGAYVPMAVAPEYLADAIAGLAALGFRGINVTVPHKEAALALVDEPDALAQRIGAVNTITIDETGRSRGTNTDVFGFLENMRAGVDGWSARQGPAAIIGAGGAARAIAFALADAGCPAIRLVNRSQARAEALAGVLGPTASIVAWADRAESLDGAALIVNATTLGMAGQPPLDLPLDAAPDDAVVTDIVYTPLQTPLLRTAQQRGLKTVDGLGMLLHQARPGFAAWFGVEPTVDDTLRAAVLATLATGG